MIKKIANHKKPNSQNKKLALAQSVPQNIALFFFTKAAARRDLQLFQETLPTHDLWKHRLILCYTETRNVLKSAHHWKFHQLCHLNLYLLVWVVCHFRCDECEPHICTHQTLEQWWVDSPLKTSGHGSLKAFRLNRVVSSDQLVGSVWGRLNTKD